MKNTRRFLIAAAALALLASVGQAKAGTGPCCDDGIAASPKVRQMLNERRGINQNNGLMLDAACCTAPGRVAVTRTTTTRQTDVAASPRVQQMRNDRMHATAVEIAPQSAGYRPTGADGITASPRVRQQLDERRQWVEIAPLK